MNGFVRLHKMIMDTATVTSAMSTGTRDRAGYEQDYLSKALLLHYKKCSVEKTGIAKNVLVTMENS